MNSTDLIAGSLCLISALALAVRMALLSPSAGAWPDAGPAPRAAMFVMFGAFAYRGLELLGLGLSSPESGLTLGALLAFGALAIYNVTMAANVARQVLPPHVWDRIKRIQGLAFCPPRGRLALLALAGIKVIPPGGRVEEVVDAVDPSARQSPRQTIRRGFNSRTGR